MANLPTPLSLGQLKWLAENYGGLSPADASTAAAIAQAESSGNPGNTGFDSNGTADRGLWQINTVHYSPNGPTQYYNQDTYTPGGNAAAMASLSNSGKNWNAWTTYNTGAYKQYLTAAQSAQATPVPENVALAVYPPESGGKSLSSTLMSQLEKLGGSLTGVGTATSAAGGVNSLGNVWGSGSSGAVDTNPGAWLIPLQDLMSPKGPSLTQTIESLGTAGPENTIEMIFMRGVGILIGFTFIGFGLASGFGKHYGRAALGATPFTRRIRQIAGNGSTDRQAVANSQQRQNLINQNAAARHQRALDLTQAKAQSQRATLQLRSDQKIKETQAREASKRRTAKYTWDLHAQKANKGSHHP